MWNDVEESTGIIDDLIDKTVVVVVMVHLGLGVVGDGVEEVEDVAVVDVVVGEVLEDVHPDEGSVAAVSGNVGEGPKDLVVVRGDFREDGDDTGLDEGLATPQTSHEVPEDGVEM